MELEGLKRSLAAVEGAGIEISTLATDRHTSIKKWMRTEKSKIRHLFDVFHAAKGNYKPKYFHGATITYAVHHKYCCALFFSFFSYLN